LAAPPDGSVFDARVHGLVGDGVTNDQPALAELVDRLGAAAARDGLGRVIHCPPGNYAIHDAGTVWRSRVSLVGAGPGVTRFLLGNPGNPGAAVPLAFHTTQQHGAGPDNHLADCTFAGFEIDGSGVALTDYNVLAKGLGLQYVLRGRFRDLYIHHTVATGFGCDFLQDTVVEGLMVVGCGRLDNGAQMGGAGIGIGIGGWGASERLSVTGCTALGNGTNGIFVELQKDHWTPPRGIRITACHTEDNRFGISDWGADGLIVSGCVMVGNHEAGYDVSAQGKAGVAGRGGIVTGCLVDGNIADGLSIGNTPGPYTVSGNRISRNGRYGFREHNLTGGDDDPAGGIVVDGNEIWGNGLDGIHVDAALTDAVLLDNRIRDNGRRCEPATSGGGPTVSYGRLSLVDTGADWRPDGHLGKTLTVGTRTATVATNTTNEIRLAPVRPGVTTAWHGGAPEAGAAYRLPDAPPHRAGITLAARTEGLTVRGNRVWDGQRRRTQMYGLLLAANGAGGPAAVLDNDLAGNAVAGARFEGGPGDGRWERNHGLDGESPPTG
jgi:hypothetical protein